MRVKCRKLVLLLKKCVCIVAIVTHLSTKHRDLIALQRKLSKEEGKCKTGFNH